MKWRGIVTARAIFFSFEKKLTCRNAKLYLVLGVFRGKKADFVESSRFHHALSNYRVFYHRNIARFGVTSAISGVPVITQRRSQALAIDSLAVTEQEIQMSREQG